MAKQEYAWEDFKVFMGGKFVTGLRGCKYKTGQDKEPIYAAGNTPVAMGRGNKKNEVSITVLQSELEAIIQSGGGDITDIAPFDIVASHIAKRGLPIVTDVIKDFEFTEFEKNWKQGDKFMEVELPGVCMEIKYNTVKN